ncbi:MAG: LytR family transcriptional regulator, partial [Corynebacterium casei]|nr:LytR family transcriptional regulator [Corynebacterium casei]
MTNETVDNSAQEPTQPSDGAEGGTAAGTTLPLRGFAMVLIAVAVMFGLWALYAFTQDNGSEQAAEDTNQQSEQQAGDANAPEPGTVGADTAQQSAEAIAPENNEGAEGAGAEGAEGAENEGQPADAEREGEEREGASGSTGSGNAAAPAPLKINVLNNSVT